MTQAEMVTLLRQHLSDEQKVNWRDDSELVAFLDRAANFFSDQLIASKDPVMLRRLRLRPQSQEEDIALLDDDTAILDNDPLVVVMSSGTLPDDFVAFVGNVPVVVIGRSVEVNIPLDVLYWGKLCQPYTSEQALIIVDIARTFALNKNEYDISPDMTLIGEMSKAVAAARAPRRTSNA